MNKKIELLGVILLAFVFAVGMFMVMPKVSAEENNLNTSVIIAPIDSIIIIDPVDNSCYIMDDNGARIQIPCPHIDPVETDSIICPTVCVPMWIIENKSCRFIECGSGCGANYINSFQTEEECKIMLKRANPPVMPPGIEKRLGLQVKFTPVLSNNLSDSVIEEGYIYDFSKMHLRIVSTEPINSDAYTLSIRMTENTNIEDSVKEVYLKAYPLNLLSISDKSDDISQGTGNGVMSQNANVINIKNSNAQVYTQVSTTKGANISKQVAASVNERKVLETSPVTIEKPNPYLKEVHTYNYIVSFEDNQKEIQTVFGKDYKDKAYNIEVSLIKSSVSAVDGLLEIIDSKKYLVKYSTSKILPGSQGQERIIIQEQVRVSEGQISSEVSQAVNKAKGRIAEVKSLDAYDIYTDEDMTEMYISNQEKVRKIKPINQVLVSNKIKAENVVGNVELVSVDNNPEYVLKIREQRKLLGFIPFGHREKYVSLNASEEIEITE